MFFQLAGLSLIVHLLIISMAAIFNFVRGRKISSAFDTKKKEHGPSSKFVSMLVSGSILTFVFVYMFSLMTLAISTGVKVGADEPQVIFMKELFGTVLGWMIATLTHPVGVLSLLVLVSVVIELSTLRYRRQYSRAMSSSMGS